VEDEGARHEFIEHTAELALRLSADTPGDLFAEACRAVGALLCEEVERTGAGTEVSRTVTVEAVDADALLVDLLNELIWLGETARWAPATASVVAWSPTRIVVDLAGPRLGRTPSRLKSATHHGVRLRRRGSRWEAEVIFDV
jgi:SHS2 domain-containing protein